MSYSLSQLSLKNKKSISQKTIDGLKTFSSYLKGEKIILTIVIISIIINIISGVATPYIIALAIISIYS